jgi:hypothetical protein
LSYQRDILNALRTNPDNLKPGQVQLRDQYFRHQPAIVAVYAFKQKLHQLLGKIATGIDPRAEKQTAELHATTLDQLFNDYIKARRELKPRTLYDYRRGRLSEEFGKGFAFVARQKYLRVEGEDYFVDFVN